MKHGTSYPNIGPGKAYRQRLFRSLASSLIIHRKISTTLTRAKAARSIIEKMITFAKSDKPVYFLYRGLVSRFGLNLVNAEILVSKIAPTYKDRPGGYTRIIRNGFDTCTSPLAILALV